ncbi:hypothetical protein V3664_23125 [Streptomyces sp. CS62]
MYFRGLDGDKAPSQPGGKRSVKVKDSEGGEIADHKQFAGQTREMLYFQGENGPLESASVTTPMLKGPTASRKRADGAAPLEAWISGVEKVSSRTVLSGDRGQRRTAVEHAYDERGRVTKTTDRGDLAKTTDDSCTLYEYKDDAEKWMFAQQSRVEVLSKACDATGIARPADVVSDTRVEYDAVGNVVKGESLASYEGGKPRYTTTGTSTHDSYGRVTSVTDVHGAVTRTAYTPAAGEIVTKVAATNQLGHTTVKELDPGRGLPLAEEDANKRRTSMEYDALGRLIKAWSPDRDPKTMIPDAEFSYEIRPGSADAPVVITNKTLLESGKYRVRYDLYDGSLRLRQTQQQALDGGRVLTDTFYDSSGHVRMENGGYYNDQDPSSQLWVPVESKIPSSTVTQYDGMGRPVATIARKNGQETWRTTTSYGGDWIAVDPPKGDTPTKAILDAQGRKTELQQFAGDGPSGPVAHSIKYAYTPKGQLDSVTDQGGNVWSYKYDIRGRQYEASDPDRGLRKTTYDIGDRVQTITDSRNKTIAVAYDALGRVTATHEGSLQGRKLTEQTYDTIPGALGLPAASTRYDENGNAYTQAVTGYDAEYRPKGSQVVIPANEGKLAGTYTYSNTYTKTLGMPQSVLFPATAGLPADRLAFGYNGLDQAHSASVNGRAFLTSSEFSRLGDLVRTSMGDANKQIISTFEFDEQTRRPTRTYRTQQAGTTGFSQISDVTTKYDDAGNVLKITDKQDGSVSAADTQCFAYDALRRMSDAWTATDRLRPPAGTHRPGLGTQGRRPRRVLALVHLRRRGQPHVGDQARSGREHRQGRDPHPHLRDGGRHEEPVAQGRHQGARGDPDRELRVRRRGQHDEAHRAGQHPDAGLGHRGPPREGHRRPGRVGQGDLLPLRRPGEPPHPPRPVRYHAVPAGHRGARGEGHAGGQGHALLRRPQRRAHDPCRGSRQDHHLVPAHRPQRHGDHLGRRRHSGGHPPEVHAVRRDTRAEPVDVAERAGLPRRHARPVDRAHPSGSARVRPGPRTVHLGGPADGHGRVADDEPVRLRAQQPGHVRGPVGSGRDQDRHERPVVGERPAARPVGVRGIPHGRPLVRQDPGPGQAEGHGLPGGRRAGEEAEGTEQGGHRPQHREGGLQGGHRLRRHRRVHRR